MKKASPTKKTAPKPAKAQPASPKNPAYPPRYEENALRVGLEWYEDAFANAAATPPPDTVVPPAGALDENDPRLLLLCMTPRSGSTALSAALSASKRLGRGGERLNRNAALRALIAEHRIGNLRQVLEVVIAQARTANGISQIKCDLPQILPFLLDPASFSLLRNARIVYLTREDILGQAISRFRGFKAGVWHSNTEAGRSGAEASYDFNGITAQMALILNMMQAYERAFAMLALQPLRITYEQLKTDAATVLLRIARLMQVDLPEGLTLDDGGYRPVSDGNNKALRAQFLADSHRLLGLG